jgi:TolA-binding protein
MATEPVSQPEPAPRPLPVVERAPTDAESAFAAGWQMLRDGNYGTAADAFGRTVALAPQGDLAEDARYWRAIAQARAGRAADARISMATFLDAHPRSARAGEISAMLGWLLYEAGDKDAAKRRFEAAADDPDARVRKSARAGLDALRPRTQ